MNKFISSLVIIFFVTFSLSFFLIPQTKTFEGTWTTMEPMPTAMSGIGVAVVNGKIYAIGSGVNYEYDPAIDAWTTKTPMPTHRSNFGIAVVDNKIYVIGGGTVVNEVYDPETDIWETKASMHIERIGLSTSVVDCKIYIIGGNRGEPTYSEVSATEVYDPSIDTWTTTEQILTPVTNHASAVVDNKIYIIGGAVGVSLNQIYDPKTDTWSTGAQLPTGVDGASAGATTGVIGPKRIYVIGGKQNLDAVNLNQVYNPETDTWSTDAFMPTARYGLGVVAVNDTLYAIGGRKGWFGSPISAANENYMPFDHNSDLLPWTPFVLMILAVTAVTVTTAAIIIYKRNYPKHARQTHISILITADC